MHRAVALSANAHARLWRQQTPYDRCSTTFSTSPPLLVDLSGAPWGFLPSPDVDPGPVHQTRIADRHHCHRTAGKRERAQPQNDGHSPRVSRGVGLFPGRYGKTAFTSSHLTSGIRPFDHFHGIRVSCCPNCPRNLGYAIATQGCRDLPLCVSCLFGTEWFHVVLDTSVLSS